MSDESRPAAGSRTPAERARPEPLDEPWFEDGFVVFESEPDEVPWDRPADEAWYDPEEGALVQVDEDAFEASSSPAYPTPSAPPYAATRASDAVEPGDKVIELDPYDEFAPVIDDVSGDVAVGSADARSRTTFDPPAWASVAAAPSPWATRRGASPGQLALGESAAGASEDPSAPAFAPPSERTEFARRQLTPATLLLALLVGIVVVGLVLAFLQLLTGMFR